MPLPGPDVQNDIARAHQRVDRALEGPSANAVADHHPVDLELRVHRYQRVLIGVRTPAS